MTLTTEQQAVMDRVRRRFRSGDRGVVIGGLAGTGKTTIAAQLPAYLSLDPAEVAYCAYTGKAASVLTRKLAGRAVATTIHGLIYHPQTVHAVGCPQLLDTNARCLRACRPVYTLVDELDPDVRLVVVDEASMVDEEIYSDLKSFGVPVVWIGDHGQLPPVRGSFNLMAEPDCRLETIHRQAADSPILQLAMLAREQGAIPFGEHGPGVRKSRSLEIDIDRDLLLLCGLNRTRVELNRRARKALGFTSRIVQVGERVICLRNDRGRGVFNGQLGTVVRRKAGRLTHRLTIQMDDGVLYRGHACVDQFGCEKTVKEVHRSVGLWDFGYCLTVHKAQGSEAERVGLIEEDMTWMAGRHASAADRCRMQARWLYTAITRAKSRLEVAA